MWRKGTELVGLYPFFVLDSKAISDSVSGLASNIVRRPGKEEKSTLFFIINH